MIPEPHDPPLELQGKNRAEALDALLEESLERGSGRLTLRVRGTCMVPLLQDGDRVHVSSGQPRRGEIWLARGRDGLICHRHLGLGQDGPLLCGDRTLNVESLAPEALLGRVIDVERSGRRILLTGSAWNLLGRWLANCQLWSHRRRSTARGRLFEALRQRALGVLHRLAWYLAARSAPTNDLHTGTLGEIQ